MSTRRPLLEDLEVLYSPQEVQVAVDNFQVDLREVGTVKELVCLEGGQVVRRMERQVAHRMEDQEEVHTEWEDLEGVQNCQKTDLGGHYSDYDYDSAVRDGYLLIPAVGVQSLWVLRNRAKGTMAGTQGCIQVDWEKKHNHRGLGTDVEHDQSDYCPSFLATYWTIITSTGEL